MRQQESTSGDSGEGDGGAASDEKHPAAASQAQPPVRAGGILAWGGGSTFEWDLEPAQRLESAIACSFVRKAAGQAQPPLQRLMRRAALGRPVVGETGK